VRNRSECVSSSRARPLHVLLDEPDPPEPNPDESGWCTVAQETIISLAMTTWTVPTSFVTSTTTVFAPEVTVSYGSYFPSFQRKG
jgi:hypothetical protein